MILIHGLGGGAYKTWGSLPEQFFGAHEDIDLGVYDYRSGLRRRPSSADLNFHLERLRGHLHDLARRYRGIYLVGHSLGGVIARAAVKGRLQHLGMTASAGNHGIHALVSIASPHLGSQWAASILGTVARDLKYLKALDQQLGQTQDFYETYVDSANVPFARPGQVILPMYAIQAGDDLFVKGTSALVGVPDSQQHRLQGGHSAVLQDSQLLDLLGEIIGERQAVLEQTSREAPYRLQAPRQHFHREEWSVCFLSDRFADEWELRLKRVERVFRQRLATYSTTDPSTTLPPLAIVIFHEDTYLGDTAEIDRLVNDAVDHLSSTSGGLAGFVIAGASGQVHQSVADLRRRLTGIDAIRQRFYVKAALSQEDITLAFRGFFDILADTHPPDILDDPWNSYRPPAHNDQTGSEDA